jgi:hypothetical protein
MFARTTVESYLAQVGKGQVCCPETLAIPSQHMNGKEQTQAMKSPAANRPFQSKPGIARCPANRARQVKMFMSRCGKS